MSEYAHHHNARREAVRRAAEESAKRRERDDLYRTITHEMGHIVPRYRPVEVTVPADATATQIIAAIAEHTGLDAEYLIGEHVAQIVQNAAAVAELAANPAIYLPPAGGE